MIMRMRWVRLREGVGVEVEIAAAVAVAVGGGVQSDIFGGVVVVVLGCLNLHDG